MSEKLPSPAVVPVEAFYSSALPDADPHRYPGERPDSSYLTDGRNVMPIGMDAETGAFTVTTETGRQNLDDWLADQGVPTLEERIPVVGYGSNMCPPTLRKKMTIDGREDLRIVPVVYGTMRGVDAVWHERPGQRGAFFAELYSGEEVSETELQVGIKFVTPEQLLLLHKTESTYDFGAYSRVRISEDRELPAFIYAGSAKILLRDHSPVAVAGVSRQNGILPVQGSKETLAYVLGADGVADAAADAIGLPTDELTPDTYTAAVVGMDLENRKKVTEAMTKAVRAAGISADFSMSEQVDHIFSWANPSTLPTFGELQARTERSDSLIRPPEQELALSGLSEAALRQRQIVLRSIRRHWHNEGRREATLKLIRNHMQKQGGHENQG